MREALFRGFSALYARIGGLGFGLGLHNRLQRALRRLVMPRFVVLEGGLRLRLNPRDAVVSYHLAADKVWEPVQTSAWLRVIKPGMVVFDVGANIGYYTLLAARAVGPSGKVVAFEPDAENLRLLRRSIEDNGLLNVEIVPKAIAAARGQARLGQEEDNKGAHALGAEGVPVETAPLDDWADQRPDVVKLDIEGSEWAALQGMSRILERRPALFVELLPSHLPVPPETVLEFLRGKGYALTPLEQDPVVVLATSA